MTERSTYVCDGCESWCKLPNGEWLRSIAYVDIREYDPTTGGKKVKKHLCTDIKDADPGNNNPCADLALDETPDGHHLDVTWAYNTATGKITGARWMESWHYDGGYETHEKPREEFPDWLEQNAALIEELIYQ